MPDAVRRAGPVRPTPASPPAQGGVCSVPFELLVSPGDIVAIVIIEQGPLVTLGKRNRLGSLIDIHTLGDCLPRFTLQRAEIAFQAAGCCGPVYARRPMARYRPRGAHVFELGELRQPAFETAVEGRNPLNEQQ